MTLQLDVDIRSCWILLLYYAAENASKINQHKNWAHETAQSV